MATNMLWVYLVQLVLFTALFLFLFFRTRRKKHSLFNYRKLRRNDEICGTIADARLVGLDEMLKRKIREYAN